MTERSALWVLVLALSTVACGGAGFSSDAPELGPMEQPPEPMAASNDPAALGADAWGHLKAKDAGPLMVLTDPGELPELRVARDQKRKLPLEHTHVKAFLAGFVSQVEVTQTFQNPFSEAIEVVYVFPLPENSAVNAMHMQIGERTIRAKIEEREIARRIYEGAKRRGHTAALLEQERPNIFTQSVANIAPREKIRVTVRYVQDLTYDDGRYEFVFPMVVGPRFIPGTPLESAMRGTGTYFDTTRVPDASRITPPVLGKGERSGHDISLELVAQNDFAVADVEVPTHDVVVRRPANGTLHVAIAEKKSLPNRDFVLRYAVAGTEPRAKLLTSGEEENGYFALVVHPPALDVDDLVGKRELIFVVDVSGSMSGAPLGMCKMAMRHAIEKLRPWDTFNIITFAGATAKVFPSARPANRHNIEQAMSFLAAARAGGGTHMDDAVAAALSADVERGRHRYVFFLTDGYVGNEQEIISGSKAFVEGIEGRGQRARVFGFGVGSSVNRALLEGLSRAGKGVAVYATTREDPAVAVNRFYRYIDRAVLTGVELVWGELGAAEVFPHPIPDLFASHPIVLHGRYKKLSKEPVTLRGRVGEKPVSIAVETHRAIGGNDRGGVLGALWARSKVEFLEEESWIGMRPSAPAEIMELGLNFDLVTAYTSFVAVDESRKVSRGDPRTVTQPVEIPEGVDARAAGADEAPVAALQPPPGDAVEQRSINMPTPDADYAEADRGPRGCNCHVVGNSRTGWAGWLAAALMALLWVRREMQPAKKRSYNRPHVGSPGEPASRRKLPGRACARSRGQHGRPGIPRRAARRPPG